MIGLFSFRHRVSLSVAALMLLSAVPAAAECSREFLSGQPPAISDSRLQQKLRNLCYSEFAVYHSGITATPLIVGQHLTQEDVRKASFVKREDKFASEKMLPVNERAELEHYRGSGFDRGHMAPAADMASDQANDESFSLANMVPQKPELNRGAWAEIEENTRRFARQYGEVYIVTGSAFTGNKIGQIGGRVMVPTALYKAVFIPSTGQASVWWADNMDGGVEVISVSKLAARTKVDPFPALPSRIKAITVGLPIPNGVRPPQADYDKTSDVQDIALNPDKTGSTSEVDQTWSEWVWSVAKEVMVAILEKILRG